MWSKKQIESVRDVYTRPKPKPQKRLETRIKGGCGYTDFMAKGKPSFLPFKVLKRVGESPKGLDG